VFIDGGSLISSFRLIIIQLTALRRKLKYAYIITICIRITSYTNLPRD